MTALKHAREFRKAIERGDIEMTPAGIVFPKQCAIAQGCYYHTVNGGDLRIDPNLLVNEGLLHMLNVALGATAKAAGWYLALFSGAVTPAANWTAANFAANATEITSASEGYSNSTRPQWVAGAAAANSIDNLASEALFNIVCTTSLNINGAALLSANTKGGTGGVLMSASRYAATRVVQNGDEYEVGYKVSLTG